MIKKIKLWKRWLHQPLTWALAHGSSVGPRMSPYMGGNGRRDFESVRLDLKRKKLQQTFRFFVDSLVARTAGPSLRLTFVSFGAFHSRIAICPGPFWVQDVALLWDRVTWFSIAGCCWGGPN